MYVITGATGHTGNIVAKLLLEQGQQVRAIGRDQERLRSLKNAGAEPCVCDLADAGALAKAFAGATAVYVMLPPDMANKDFRALQDRLTESIATALANAGVEFAVTLSSIGADKPDKTGPVVGLHNLEQRLNAIAGLNVLHLRAAYFMENTLAQADVIHAMDKAAGPLRPDLKIPMIASRDIGLAAAKSLLQHDFSGRQTRELHGQRDLSMTEVAEIIGHAIGKPDLTYEKISDDAFRGAAAQMGMSESFANLMLEMVAALNSGYMRPLAPPADSDRTATSFETFVAEEFVPLYEGRVAHV